MPIHADLDPVAGVIRTKATTPVTFKDIHGHLKTLQDTHAFEYPELLDIRELCGPEPSMHELRSLAWTVRNMFEHASPANRALVVTGDPALRSARFVAALMSGCMQLGVFEEEAAAKRWLGAREAVLSTSADERSTKHP
jgi:hypothetical protein